MNKEEILLASRQEHRFRDLHEMEAQKRIPVWCVMAPAVLACILMWVESIILPERGAHYGYSLIIFGTVTAFFIHLAIKLKQKLLIFCAVVQIFALATTVLAYIRFLTAQAHG